MTEPCCSAARELALVQESRERIHARFRSRVDGVCACPYCTQDAEALGEMAANYELELHSATQKLDAAYRVLARAGVLNPVAAVRAEFMNPSPAFSGGRFSADGWESGPSADPPVTRDGDPA